MSGSAPRRMRQLGGRPPSPSPLLIQVHHALFYVRPPATERCAVPLLEAAAAHLETNAQADSEADRDGEGEGEGDGDRDRAAFLRSLAARFRADPEDGAAFVELRDRCAQWRGLAQSEFERIMLDAVHTSSLEERVEDNDGLMPDN